MEPKRNLVKIIIGIVIILAAGTNLIKGLNHPANNAETQAYIFTGVLIVIGGFYLLYRGLYPPK